MKYSFSSLDITRVGIYLLHCFYEYDVTKMWSCIHHLYTRCYLRQSLFRPLNVVAHTVCPSPLTFVGLHVTFNTHLIKCYLMWTLAMIQLTLCQWKRTWIIWLYLASTKLRQTRYSTKCTHIWNVTLEYIPPWLYSAAHNTYWWLV